MASLFISAAHKSSGKTTVSIGLCAALRKQNHSVQAFKKGPDFIDPAWLSMASGEPCYTLDFYTAGVDETVNDFSARGANADYTIVEGNKGLYDGLDLDGSNSNAALAKALNTPVILVIDCHGMMRGIAPLLLGYQAFDDEVKIAGIIANKTGGARHQSKLRMAVEHYTDIPFLGALDRHSELVLPEQHIGLIPAYENTHASDKISIIRQLIESNIDVKVLTSLAAPVKSIDAVTADSGKLFTGIRIGIARDKAFGFYYSSDLERFEQLGATLLSIDTLSDPQLPELDGLFIGGGFPERQAAALEYNTRLRTSIRAAIDNGMPVYAECGGLMYLTNSLTWNDKTYNMVGALPGNVTMHTKPQGRGYVELRERAEIFPWPVPNLTTTTYAHEFHYSSIDLQIDSPDFAYSVNRGVGINGIADGWVYKNVLASYTHRRDTRQSRWVERFLSFVELQRTAQSQIVTAANHQ